MIERLGTPKIAFGANLGSARVRDGYENVVKDNNKIAQAENARIANVQKQSSIPMQGVGEKLDTLA